jgi:hypothetical protein
VALANIFDGEAVDARFNYLFDHCIIKGQTDLDTLDTDHFKNILWDKDPRFVNPAEEFNFAIDSLSPAINAGNPDYSEGLEVDLFNNNRLKDGLPDLGALEYIPKPKKE